MGSEGVAGVAADVPGQWQLYACARGTDVHVTCRY